MNFGSVVSPVAAPSPSGYQQNAYAQDMSPAQRASLDQEDRKGNIVQSLGLDKLASGLTGGGGSGGGHGGGGSLGGSGSGEGSVGETASQAWETAKGWVGALGKKAAETEEQVWKRINGN